jgi:hypothetical protein
VVTQAAVDVKTTNSTEDRYSCAVETKLLQSCPWTEPYQQGQLHHHAGPGGRATARDPVSDGRSVVADTVGGDAKHYRCADENTPTADNGASWVAHCKTCPTR